MMRDREEREMNRRWKATFDADGECWWMVDGGSEEEARENAVARFRADRFWSQRYPETPPLTLEEINVVSGPPDGGSHGDVGPFYG
jgi:hypothetical protein